MHLVIVTPEYPPHAGGGILKFYRTLTPHYVTQGLRVTVLVAGPFSDEFPDYVHDGVTVRCVPLPVIKRHADRLAQLSSVPLLRRWLGAAQAAAAEVIDLRPDVVEATDFGLLFAALLASGCPVLTIVQMHGSLGQVATREPARSSDELDVALARVIEATLPSFADEIQAYSPLNANEWSGRLQRPCVFLPPPMECGKPADVAASEAALVVARIQPWKGPDVLCEALQRLRAPAGTLKIEWIGRDTMTASDGGSLNAYLGTRYAGIWGDVIRPVGPRTAAGVRAAQQRARFVIVPSAWDTFNLAAAEAMAAGRVVVCSDGVGASFLIRDGMNGFLFKSGDPGSLADTLRRVIDLSAVEARRIGEGARHAVAENLDPQRTASLRVERMRTLAATAEHPRSVPDWLTQFVIAEGDRRVSSDFLDSVSIRELARHLTRRLRGRVFGRPGAEGSP